MAHRSAVEHATCSGTTLQSHTGGGGIPARLLYGCAAAVATPCWAYAASPTAAAQAGSVVRHDCTIAMCVEGRVATRCTWVFVHHRLRWVTCGHCDVVARRPWRPLNLGPSR